MYIRFSTLSSIDKIHVFIQSDSFCFNCKKVEFGDISRSTRYVTVKLIGVEPNILQINVITWNNKNRTLSHFTFMSQLTKVDFGSLFELDQTLVLFFVWSKRSIEILKIIGCSKNHSL